MSKKRRYTQEEKDWIVNAIKTSKDKSWITMADDFEREFGYKRTRHGLKAMGAKLGYRFKQGKSFTKYTEEQEEWLKKYSYKLTLDRIVTFFNVRFKDNRPYSSIREKCANLGLNWISQPKGAEAKPIGSVNFTSREESYIKVEEPNEWITLARYMWEVYNKDEELGDRVIVQLDKNPYNFKKDNLMAVSKSTLVVANRIYKLTDNAEINRTILLLAEVKAEAHKKAREYEKESSKSS